MGREGGAGVSIEQPDPEGVYAHCTLHPILSLFRGTLQPYLHFADGETDIPSGEVPCHLTTESIDSPVRAGIQPKPT